MSGTITFPPNPTDGQLYTAPNGTTWIWHANPGVWANANTPTNFLPLSGGTMSGAITLAGNAATALQAVPLQQVVPIAGGTMTGALTLSGNAATALQATPLQQVNAVVAPAFNDIGRNLLHNAEYRVQQRGQGPWTASGYTADRWAIYISTDTNSASLVGLGNLYQAAIGDEDAISALQYVFTCSAAAGAYTSIAQNIEQVWRLSGKTVTISFWAKAASGAPHVGINILQSFGTGGSPSPASRALATGNSVILSTTWTRYTSTIAIPSLAGKTVGTNGDSFTRLELWLSSGATNNAAAGNIGVQSGTVEFWGVQCEIAQAGQTQPTPLEKLDPVLQLQQCQRFYQVGSLYQGGSAGAASVTLSASYTMPVPMRASPTCTAGPSGDAGVVGTLTVGPFGSPTSTIVGSCQSTASGAFLISRQSFTASADL